MSLLLLLLSSVLLTGAAYVSYTRMHTGMKKTFLFLLSYRFGFFMLQSFLFYTVYRQQVDAALYHTALLELFQAFKEFPSDSIRFFQGDYTAMHVSPWLQAYLAEETRVAFFLKVLSVFFAAGAADYYMTGAWLTFAGTLCFMPFLSLFKNKTSFLVWLMVLCVPSFTIWTVGLLKEAVVLPALFLLYYLWNKIIESRGKDIRAVLFFLVLLLVVWYVKYYLAALFVLVCFVYSAGTYFCFNAKNIILAVLCCAAILLGLGYLHPALQFKVLPEVIYISYTLTCTKFVEAYSCIPFDLDMTWTSILLNYPKAMLYAFFSPFPWQIHNVTSLLAALESYVFVGLAAAMVYRWCTKKTTLLRLEILSLLLVLLTGALLILASPNIGSFSRYRIFYLPVYACILIKHSGILYTSVFLRIKEWIVK